jgi:hypothetical protein
LTNIGIINDNVDIVLVIINRCRLYPHQSSYKQISRRLLAVNDKVNAFLTLDSINYSKLVGAISNSTIVCGSCRGNKNLTVINLLLIRVTTNRLTAINSYRQSNSFDRRRWIWKRLTQTPRPHLVSLQVLFNV